MKNLFLKFDKNHPIPWVILGSIIAVVIGVIDFITGYELALSLFYLFPISMTTWNAGRRSGLTVSVFSALIWYIADAKSGHLYSHEAIIYWNTGIIDTAQ